MNERLFYRKAFAWTALGIVLGVVMLYPQFCNGVDPDATSYLTLARRWTRGDFARAVNGYWSPLSIWLTALLMRVGMPEIPAAFIQNTAASILFLGASLALFRKFGVSLALLRRVVPALGFFLLHAIFHQWFSDLWGAAFTLLAFHTLLQKNFFQKPASWVLYGLLGALAYLSKSLFLPFWAFILCWAALRTARVPAFRKLIAVGTALSVLVLMGMPWWLALKEHYGFWTTGVTGSLNLSWAVAGHPIFTTTGGAFLPPLYPDSVSFWEDPWWVNARLVHVWDSPRQALQMIPRVGYFFLRLLEKSVLLSFFVPVASYEILQRLWQHRFRLAGDLKTQLLQISMIAFPLPFLLLYGEVRYLWFLVPMVVIWAHLFLLNKHFNRIVAGLLAASLCAYGASDFPQLWHLGAAEQALANSLRESGFSGDFATSSDFSYGESLRVAYFSGMRYWAPKSDTIKSPDVLLREAREADVPFILDANGLLQTDNGKLIWKTPET